MTNTVNKKERLDEITIEINRLKKEEMKTTLQIGELLLYVKNNKLVHGEFGQWLEQVGFNQSTANKLMKAYAMFGNSESITNLGRAKLFELISLPKTVNVDEFIVEEHIIPSTGERKTVDTMTVKELKEVKVQFSNKKQTGDSNKKAGQNVVNDAFTDDITKVLSNLTSEFKAKINQTKLSLDIAYLLGQLNLEVQERFTLVIEEMMSTLDRDCFISTFDSLKKLATKDVCPKKLLEFYLFKRKLRFLISMLFIPKEEYSLIDDIEKEFFEKVIDMTISQVEEFLGNAYETIRNKIFNSSTESNSKSNYTMKSSDTAYKILGVSVETSPEDLKKKKRKLSKLFHPDTGGEFANPYLFQLVVDSYDLIASQKEQN